MQRSTKNNIVVLFGVACLYALNRFWLKNAVNLPVVSYILKCHFSDFLAGIAILAYINALLSISKYSDGIINTLHSAAAVTGVCGVLWEYVFPAVFTHGTTDFLDIIAYVAGGIAYTMLIHIWK